VFDGTLIFLLVILVGIASLAYWRGGTPAVAQGLGEGWSQLVRFAPMMIVSFLAAGYADFLIPPAWVREQLGDDSGLRGIALATGVGIVTPAGPFVSMPVAAAMIRLGEGAGPVVAFLSSWSLLALHRMIAWEVPILGWRFALVRYTTCSALPFIAGFAARALSR
jgi:uncharacterized membrane protein YraQ (UPF0718 family)